MLGLAGAGLKAQLRRADRTGARYALIIGEDECAAGEVSVKPLLSGEPQSRMALPQFMEVLRQTAPDQALSS